MLRNLFDRFRSRSPIRSAAGCSHVQSRLLAYLDFELSPSARTDVESHLEKCAECRTELAGYRRAESMLGAATASIPSPGDLRAEFYQRLEQSRRRPAISRWAIALPAAAGIVAMCIFAPHIPSGRKPPRVQSTVAAVTPPVESRAGAAVRDENASPAPNGLIGRLVDESANRGFGRNSSPLEKPRRLRLPHNRAPETALRGKGKRHSVISRRKAVSSPQYARNDNRSPGTLLGHPGAAYDYALAAKEPLADKIDMSSKLLEAEDARKSGELSAQTGRKGGRVALASLVTELHVSDENRDFMSSTHIDARASQRDRMETLRVDEDNDNAQESVELPALP